MTTNTKPEGIPMPTSADMTASERAEYLRDMAILDSDPRTAGGANRPSWLVRRVLADAKVVR